MPVEVFADHDTDSCAGGDSNRSRSGRAGDRGIREAGILSPSKTADGTGFPFWPLIALSLGFGLFAVLYHAIIGLLLR